MRSLFPWMGSKSRTAKDLIQLLPEHTCYVEVFSGAANLLFTKDRSDVEVINDINDDVANLFRIARHHPRELVRQLCFTVHSRKDYMLYQSSPGLTDIQRAARSWFIFRGSYGGRGGCLHPAYSYAPSGFRGFKRGVFSLLKQCHRRLDRVYIENLDFKKCIVKYDRANTFFYCDPPYLKTSGYKYPFGIEEHKQLAEALAGIKGKFLLSINNHETIRSLYKGFRQRKINVRYSVSRVKTPEARNRTELIVANYKLPSFQQKKKQ